MFYIVGFIPPTCIVILDQSIDIKAMKNHLWHCTNQIRANGISEINIYLIVCLCSNIWSCPCFNIGQTTASNLNMALSLGTLGSLLETLQLFVTV